MKHVPPPEGEPLSGLDNLAMAVPPKWGEAILRLAKATERVAAKLDELPPTTDAQYIPKVRQLAKSLIDFLDRLEDTDQDTASDDEPCDDNELDGPEKAEDEQSEPDEPSLGSGAVGEWSDQAFWSKQSSEYRSLANADLEDEHDGAEDDHEGDDNPDNEPSLGWGIDGERGNISGSDRELQDHATVVPAANREKLPDTIDVEQRGYGGRTVIRNLTDGHTKALAERMDRHGPISLK
jgi:hypothetical protein